jgi:hypothetical protein
MHAHMTIAHHYTIVHVRVFVYTHTHTYIHAHAHAHAYINDICMHMHMHMHRDARIMVSRFERHGSELKNSIKTSSES